MDILQLRTFLAVREAGSFSAAGEKLHSVQSNVTARIRKLENSLGGSLFERGRNGARLTPLGERLMPHARDILARITSAENDLKDLTDGAAPLKLGALETTAGSRLPKLLKGLSLAMPRADVSLNTCTSSSLMRMVWERSLDAAFVVGAVYPDRFHSVKAFDESLVLVQSATQSGSNTLLAFKDGCSYRAAAKNWLDDEGRVDTPVRDLGSLDAILGCVGAGMGFAIAPESAVKTYNALDTLSLTLLEGSNRASVTHLIWRIDMRPTRTLKALIDIL